MGEREPMNWSMPLPGTILGVTVRVHILFPVVALGVILWVATSHEFASGHQLWREACAVLAMLFGCVFLHEFGHVFGARRVGGDVMEVLLWPLGGLAEPDVPPTPGSHFWTAIYGPAVNFALALCAGTALGALGFIPPFNPLASPLNPRMENWRNDMTYFSVANPGQAEYWFHRDEATGQYQQVKITKGRTEDGTSYLAHASQSVEPGGPDAQWMLRPSKIPLLAAKLDRWHILLAQFFWVNWLLFLVNMLWAYPLDGAKLLQCWLWRRGDRRQATATAAYGGFLVMLGVGVYAIAVNDLVPALLAAMIYVRCRQQLIQLEQSEEEPTQLGYDFSQGYTSLERQENEEPPPPPPPKRSWLRQLLARRTALRREREELRRLEEERRLDELLDKIHRQGKQSLSEDEVRFLTRMSSKYPNRKES
jgi:Zn-dependent protease